MIMEEEQQQPQPQQQQQQQQQEQQPMLPIGYKFRPTDRELMFYFLKNKLKHPTMFQSAAPIYEIQLYDHHPQIILDNFGVQGQNNNLECYVFTMRHRKFLRGSRASRVLKDNVGYWRASYNHGDQFQERRQGGLVGERMNLVYYNTTTSTDTSDKKKGVKKGTKTDWLMNEYKIKPADDDDGAEEDLVLCRIYFNSRPRNKGISNHHHQQQQYYNMQQEQQDMQQQQQQQQEQQPAAVNTEIEAGTYGELMSQTPEPQQTGAGIFMPEQPHLWQQQQQQQEQQPAAVDYQTASNTGIYKIDTEIDGHTFWNQLMSQPPEPQQTGLDMISIDDYA